ncbi:MAG: hypothetical protein WC602_05690 [archaeon]
MKKMKKGFLLLFLTGSVLLSGCASLIAPPAKLPDMTKAAEQEKIAFVEKNIGYSRAHKSWAEVMSVVREGKVFTIKMVTYPFEKPKFDYAALKIVKKVAILSFGVDVDVKSKLKGESVITRTENVDMTPIQPFVNTMYDELSKSLKQQGIEVISAEVVKSNPEYQMLEFKEIEEGGQLKEKVGWWEGSADAYGLKRIDAGRFPGVFTEREQKKAWGAERYEKMNASTLAQTARKVGGADKQLERAKRLQNAAKSLGVDAVILVDNHVRLEQSGFTGGYDVKFAQRDDLKAGGVVVNMYLAKEIEPIWSAQMKRVDVPTKARKLGALLGAYSVELDKVAPDIVLVYRDIADLIALKLKLDQQK